MTLQNRKIQFYSSNNVSTIYIINKKGEPSPIKTQEGTQLQEKKYKWYTKFIPHNNILTLIKHNEKKSIMKCQIFLPVPIVNICSIRPLFHNPSRITFAPLRHFISVCINTPKLPEKKIENL